MPRVESSRPGSAEGLDRDILVLGGVMTVLDLTVVNVAIPTLGRAFDASITAIQWVVTGYMLAFASVIPLTGWASERFGAKRVWLASLLLFLAGSVLAGAAWSLPSLIGFRVLQGLGAGMILPVGQTILAQAAGPARMGRVMSVIGVPMLLAPVFGPVLGGAIVDSTSWRWIFYLNLPLFRRRGFAAATVMNFLLPVALFGALILLPLYYQVVRRENPLNVGLLLIPQGLGAAVAMPIAGRLTDKLGERPVVVAGLLVAVVGTLAYTGVGAETSYAYLAAALFVFGLGIGSTIMPSMAAAFQTLERDETPRATSALNAVQRIAGAIGTALLAIVLQRELAAKLPNLHGGISGLARLSARQHAAVAPALADAFATTFWVAAALIAIAVVPALLP